MSKNYKNCQSCGMPLARDEFGGGTEMDGSKSSKYCSHCFADGQFILPNITASEMKERVRTKLVEFGFPRFITGFFVRNIMKLERWDNSKKS